MGHLILASNNPAPIQGAAQAPAELDREPGTFARTAHRHLQPETQRETRHWRELAKAHEAARARLNAMLPAYGGAPANMALPSPDSPMFVAARQAYRRACAALLDYPNPKPRHLPTLLRAAAEVMNLPDPVWSSGIWSTGEGCDDVVFCRLYHRVTRALTAVDQ